MGSSKIMPRIELVVRSTRTSSGGNVGSVIVISDHKDSDLGFSSGW